MQIPTPVIYLAEDEEGKQLTIDGHQRLKSIYRFWSNDFPLKNLTVFKELNGKYFKDLDKKYQRALLNGVIRTILIRKLENPRLLQITLHTFRHWKATTEYAKTKDILHVMQLLGHKSIQNTLVYTHLVKLQRRGIHRKSSPYKRGNMSTRRGRLRKCLRL